MADVFAGVASDFDEMIQGLGDELMLRFKRGLRSANVGTAGKDTGDDAERQRATRRADTYELR